MPQTVLRAVKRNRWLLSFLFLAALGLFILLSVEFFGDTLPSRSMWRDRDLVLLLLFTFFPLLLGHQALFYWTYRLEFHEREIQTHHVWHPFVPRLHCTYDHVVEVKGQELNKIRIVPREGNPVPIDLLGLEGGKERLLEELTRRIDRDRFHTNLQAHFRPDRRKELVFAVLSNLYVFLLVWGCVWFYVNLGRDYFDFERIVWNTVDRQGSYFYPEAFSLDLDGSLWVIMGRGMSIGNEYEVQHVTAAGVETWDAPAEADDWYVGEWIQGVARDDRGNPRVVYERRLFHWTGESWQVQPGPLEEEGYRIAEYHLATYGSELWAVLARPDSTSQVLVQIDLNSGDWQSVLLPGEAEQNGWEIKRFRLLADGSLLARMDENRFYLLQDGRWQEYAGPQAEISFQDFAVDPNGRLWALTKSWRNDAWMIGQYDPDTSSWSWSEVGPAGNSSVREYRSIQLDSLGRVWLAGIDDRARRPAISFIAVFEPIPGTRAHRIVEYNEDNSNYQDYPRSNNLQLHLGPDGRIWPVYGRLLWMDSTAPKLPRPLPGLLTEREQGHLFLLGSLIGLIASIALAAWQEHRKRWR